MNTFELEHLSLTRIITHGGTRRKDPGFPDTMDAIPALNHLPLDFDMEETQNSPLIKPLFIFFLSQTESYMTYIY